MHALVQRGLDKVILYETRLFRKFSPSQLFLFNPLPYSQSVLTRPIKLVGKKFSYSCLVMHRMIVLDSTFKCI